MVARGDVEGMVAEAAVDGVKHNTHVTHVRSHVLSQGRQMYSIVHLVRDVIVIVVRGDLVVFVVGFIVV